jgi:DNA mismatch endonuclease, patch repair protein
VSADLPYLEVNPLFRDIIGSRCERPRLAGPGIDNQFRMLFFTMADIITSEHRSWNMSRIRGCNTGPELRVRSLLHRLGFRFSLGKKDLPGKPDIVLTRFRTVILVHGCFWHRHANCKNSVVPKTRREFWLAKLSSNVSRDRHNAAALKALGWQVRVVWECELRNGAKLSKKIIKWLTPSNAK